MNAGEKNNNEDCQAFLQGLDDTLSEYFALDPGDISSDELSLAFPIQTELTDISELYEELGEVAHGGMKKILRVRDLKGNRTVAMARLLKEGGRENTERFLREGRLTGSLQHPNIIPVYDIGFDKQQRPFFTMELLKGETLSSVIGRITFSDTKYEKKYSLNLLLDIFSRICDAIAYAHSRQVIHLDLKPENIHIGEFGEVAVIDWGLAKILTDDEEAETGAELDPNVLNQITIEGVIKGTPGYMAPEQVQRYGLKDTRSDIYSLGAILYTCLTGRAPIEGETLDDVLQNTISGSLVNNADLTQKIPAGLKALVLKSLSVNPDDRYQTVTDLREDLENYRHGFATEAEAAGFLTQFTLLLKRHKKMLSLIGAFMVLLTGVLIISFKRISDERGEARRLQAVAEKNLALFSEEQKLSNALRHDLDGFFRDIVKSDDMSSAKQKIALLEEGLKRGSNKNGRMAMWRKKGMLHFVIQEFEQASECFDNLPQKSRISKLARLASWAAGLKSDNESFSDSQLASLITKMGSPLFEMSELMYYKHMRFNDRSEETATSYLPLASIMLNNVNNVWDKHKISQELDYSSGRLSLAGRNFRNFCIEGGYGLNILKPLKLSELDISKTAFFEFVHLRALRLKVLNISACKVNEINQNRCDILHSIGVKKVIFDSRFLTNKEVRFFKANFTIEDLFTKN